MESKTINPQKLVTRHRLDLVVKFLYAKEIIESENYDYSTNCYEDLYIRHILMRTLGEEPNDINGNKSSKHFVDDYIASFKNLINEIKEKGYNKEFPIPVAADGLLANGAHRVAASLALNTEVTVMPYKTGCLWDFHWFCENGFNTEDKQRILKGFIDIHSDKCAIFVIWNPLFKYIENVKSVINKYFDIVGDVDLDFEDNYIAFTNALLEIYEPNISLNGNETTIIEKAKLLQANYLSFKVIVVTNQGKNSDKTISELSKQCKDEIRNLFNHLLPKECFCSVHSSDCEEETIYLSNILLSPNNIKHLKMRLSVECTDNFVLAVRNLPQFVQTKGISANEITIIGTGVMHALGIIKEFNSDIDFIIDHKYREIFGYEAVKLNENYDIAYSSNETDNIIIYDDNYHFWFKGIKFANLEIIKDRKLRTKRSKDLIHLRQIDLFEKMLGNINQQKILMERIEAEKLRRANLEPIDIFSVKNELTNNIKRKVITILGIKLKFKVKDKAVYYII